jgi:RNA polymerase sigma-70 factor (ECF subfamily)
LARPKDLASLERLLGVMGSDELSGSAVAVTWDEFLGCYDGTVVAVHRYLFRACGGDSSLAEDLAQDVYTAALVRARDGDMTVLVLPWLLAVARNKLVDHFRRVDRERRELALVELEVPGSMADRDGPLIARLVALPPLQRAAVALRYVDDLPVDEVARALGKSRKATESLLSRARETLRREPSEGRNA